MRKDQPDTCGTTPLWQLGDRWTDFAPVLYSEYRGAVGFLTASGSAHALDVTAGWQFRSPGAFSSILNRDLERRPLARVEVATSCGLVLYSGEETGGYRLTTQVVLVAPIIDNRWVAADVAEAAVALYNASGWSADGHPARECGARYCRLP